MPRRHTKWDEMKVKLAVKAIVVEKQSKRSVSKQFGIPRQTLQDCFIAPPSGDFDDPHADVQQIQVNGGECDADFESRAEEMVHSGRSPSSIISNEPSSFSELAGLSSH